MGCSYELPDNINRDDLMDTGFLPNYFTPPIKIKITKIVGDGLTPTDLKCDKTSLDLAKKNFTAVSAMSFKPILFLTLTDMEQLDDPAGEGDPAMADFARPTCLPGMVTFVLMVYLAVRGFSRWGR